MDEVFDVRRNIETKEKIAHATLEILLLIKFARYANNVSKLIFANALYMLIYRFMFIALMQ